MQRYTLKQCTVQQINEDTPVLLGLPVGSQVGLALDRDRCLHLFVDEEKKGVVARDIPDPCYFMFDLAGYCTKVLRCSCHLQ